MVWSASQGAGRRKRTSTEPQAEERRRREAARPPPAIGREPAPDGRGFRQAGRRPAGTAARSPIVPRVEP